MKLEISIGEMVDKLTILQIKSEKIQDTEKLEFINKELNIIMSTLGDVYITYPQLKDYTTELQNVNNKLWDIENSIRQKELLQQFDDEFITLARSVYHNNDTRAKIKNKINVYTNSNLREVKQYTEYL